MTPETAQTAPEPVAPPTPDPYEALTDGYKELLAVAKKQLDWQIQNREAFLTIAGKRLVFRKWGMRDHLALGGKVHALFARIMGLAPDRAVAEMLTPEFMLQLLSQFADDILDILVRSTKDTFKTHDEGVRWFDENLTGNDVFLAGVLVYDQNLGGDGEPLGKAGRGLEDLTANILTLVGQRLAPAAPSA